MNWLLIILGALAYLVIGYWALDKFFTWVEKNEHRC
jgi:hypothetical protein